MEKSYMYKRGWNEWTLQHVRYIDPQTKYKTTLSLIYDRKMKTKKTENPGEQTYGYPLNPGLYQMLIKTSSKSSLFLISINQTFDQTRELMFP